MIFFYYFGLFLFFLVSLILCAVILMQESKGTGLGASFGGDVSQSVFGTATAAVLKKFTGWMAVIFFGACILFSAWTSSLATREMHALPVQLEETNQQ